MTTELAKRDGLTLKSMSDKELLRAVAMDIGKQVAHHIETMYPSAVKAASSTFLLSVRNCTHNEIVAWVESDWEPKTRLEFNDKFRRYIRAQYKKRHVPAEDSPEDGA